MDDYSTDRAIEQAIKHQAEGRLTDAERLYRRVLAADARHPEANHNLGTLLLGLNRLQDALMHLKAALEADPKDGQLWVSYIDALIHAARYQSARAVLEAGRRRGLAGAAVDALQRRIDVLEPRPLGHTDPRQSTTQRGEMAGAAGPGQPSADEKSRILALREAGRYAQAGALARALAERCPGDSWTWKTLGNLLQRLGELQEALQAIRTAIQLTPGDAEGHFELGVIFDRLGHVAEAEASIRRALQLDPKYAEAYHALGLLLERTHRPQEAESSHRRALALRPDWTDALSSLAVSLTYQGKLDAAEEIFRRAIAIQPRSSSLHVDLSIALRFHGKLDEAEAALRQAIALQPDDGNAYVNLAGILRDTNRLDEAEALLGDAIKRYPLMTEARSNLLFSHNYGADHSPQYCLEEARQYGEAVRRRVTRPYSSWLCADDPPRLRVGITSGDIHSHPVGFFLEGVVGHLDRDRIELFGYPTSPRADALTERVRRHFAAWHSLVGFPDEAAARRIHADGLHLLIELSGHTPRNRLPILAWKPAPLQVSWLGYFATTGVEEIDYLLADEVSVPQEHASHFTEEIWYLPDTRLCFAPPDTDVLVHPLPALTSGVTTFGTFQDLSKLSDRTLSLWGRVIAQVPAARLRVQSARLSSASVRAHLIERLASAGVARERVSMHGPVPRASYLAAYANVDMVLDTTPFPGGTTTCEALWMGVPTLTLAGDRLISRQGASLMCAAGLPEWVADDDDMFVSKAIAFGSDLRKLSELRSGLRDHLRRTPLCDARRFAANLQTALWQMWRRRRQAT